jgi:hypothetical protein
MNFVRLVPDRFVALRSRTKARFAHRASRSETMRTKVAFMRFVAGLPDRDGVSTVGFR